MERTANNEGRPGPPTAKGPWSIDQREAWLYYYALYNHKLRKRPIYYYVRT